MHIKNFRNLTEILRPNLKLLNNITKEGKIILNKDDDYFNFLKNALKKDISISFSKNYLADVYIKK